MAEKTDDIQLRIPKGLKEKYCAEAEKHNEDMTQFITSAIRENRKRARKRC